MRSHRRHGADALQRTDLRRIARRESFSTRTRWSQRTARAESLVRCRLLPRANITRFLASVPGYVYALQGDTIFVNLFAKGTAEVTLPDSRKVTLSQETRYPWDGAVRLTVAPERPGSLRSKCASPAGRGTRWSRATCIGLRTRMPNAPRCV